MSGISFSNKKDWKISISVEKSINLNFEIVLEDYLPNEICKIYALLRRKAIFIDSVIRSDYKRFVETP